MTGLLELLAQCRAGDVLLTGQRGGLSKMITWAGGAPVSHALLVVADGVAVEARDARWDMREEGKGVRIVRLDSLPALLFYSVIAVRPHQQPNGEAMRQWAVDVERADAPFASVGLSAMAPLLLAAQIEARAHRLGLLGVLFHPFFRHRRRRLAELVADGTHRVICAELVYRGLQSGGVEVDLSVAQFATSMAELPAAVAPVPNVTAVPTGEELLARALPSSVLSPSSLPQPRLKYLIAAASAGWGQLKRRAHRDYTGDRADLVTPADLLRSPTMRHLWEWKAPTSRGGRSR